MPRCPRNHRIDDQEIQSSVRPWVPFWHLSEVPNCPIESGMRTKAVRRLFCSRRKKAPFEQGEIGPDLFRHACLLGLEGMVSKHRESAYRGGRSRTGSIQRSAACWISSKQNCAA